MQTFTCPQCKQKKTYQKGFLICSDCQDDFLVESHEDDWEDRFFETATPEEIQQYKEQVFNFLHH